ncbi:RNA-binding transcriptional accessory protein, partial [Streptococcus suis]
RIPGAKNILDNTGVHPESYPAVKELFKVLEIHELDEDAKAKLAAVTIPQMAETLGIGLETLNDIITALLKPGRDLRDDFEAPILRQDILDLKDLAI